MKTEALLEECRKKGLRVTKGLRAILTVFNNSNLPLSLSDLESNPSLVDLLDRATIFRSLQRLESIGLLRKLHFSDRSSKYSIQTGHSHQEYLICKECNDVQIVDIACPVHALEESVAKETGFTKLQHELTFYGLCKDCSE